MNKSSYNAGLLDIEITSFLLPKKMKWTLSGSGYECFRVRTCSYQDWKMVISGRPGR